MAGLSSTEKDGGAWLAWKGNPSDEAAHQLILARLREVVPAGFLGAGDDLSDQTKGNLGEFIAYCIGDSYVFANAKAFGANTADPLSRISKPDVDIVWLHFGVQADQDWAAIQEVTTTGQASLGLADSLIADYEKLFGEDLTLTLASRLTVAKNKLEQMGSGELCERVTSLMAPSPHLAWQIQLVPTLLHDSQVDPARKLIAVRQALIARGWTGGAVQCWSVSFRDIDRRLIRLARGLEP